MRQHSRGDAKRSESVDLDFLAHEVEVGGGEIDALENAGDDDNNVDGAITDSTYQPGDRLVRDGVDAIDDLDGERRELGDGLRQVAITVSPRAASFWQIVRPIPRLAPTPRKV